MIRDFSIVNSAIMNIVPTLRCKDMRESLSFYTTILDFHLMETWPESATIPSYSILVRENAELHLSTYSGDGRFGGVVSILIPDVDNLFLKFLGRGLVTPDKHNSPVHQGPVDQTWGTREFYVDDPNDNTIRFVQRYPGPVHS